MNVRSASVNASPGLRFDGGIGRTIDDVAVVLCPFQRFSVASSVAVACGKLDRSLLGQKVFGMLEWQVQERL
jgi:hypothetical protein